MTVPGNEPPKRENLLHTKLMPPRLHSSSIQREDLLARLDDGLDRKLSLVVAPTGYGKTTLVSMWIASRDFSSAWVGLDENDNDPSRFWTYVISAIRTFDSSVGKSTLAALTTAQPPVGEVFLTPLINELMLFDKQCVLVLEDYHSITSKEINDGIAYLIQHLPESFHLVLITRTNPELPLSLLRVRDELVEIDADDLRFKGQDAEEFLRSVVKADLPSSAIAELTQKTEGWVAGLRLAAASMQNKTVEEAEEFIQTFSGSHRYISDYLIDEVYRSQPEQEKDFLLKTCFLKRLNASLCDAVVETTESATMLDRLERDNTFVTQLEQGGVQKWYRYNPLFAEAMQQLARQTFDEATINSLHEKAGNWYEYHGMLEDAIETSLSINRYEHVMTLIEKYMEIHDLRELYTLNRWLSDIPQQDIFEHPLICFTYAQIILYSGDRFAPATANQIEPFLSAAESIWQENEDHGHLGQLLSFRGNVSWWLGDLQKAFEYARGSLAELPESDVFWRGNSLLILGFEALNEGRILDAQDLVLEARALLGAAQNIYGVLAAMQLMSEVFYQQGEFEQAEELNQQILNDAVGDESMLDDQGIASLSLARIAYERDDLEQAQELATRALDLGKRRANETLQAQATIQLAHVLSAKGEYADARNLVKSLEAEIQNTNLLRELQSAQALFAIRANEAASLDWWVKIMSAESQNGLLMQREQEAFTMARLQIMKREFNEALDTLKDWQIDSAQNGRVRSQVESLLLGALAYHADSNLSQAKKPLIEALTIGQAKGFRRTFLDEGARMAALLHSTLSSLPNRTLSLFATTLLHSFEALPLKGATSSGLALSIVERVQIEALSQQEIRVLRLLVAGLSNADIARELVVSTNTIKTHVKSIYRKLNVKSRSEAREVARELKLV